MDVMFRSVVGKLWMTIIALFAVVLTIFSLLLVQSFDSYYLHKQTEDLKGLSQRLAGTIEKMPNNSELIGFTSNLWATYRTGLIVVDGQLKPLNTNLNSRFLPNLTINDFLRRPELQLGEVLQGTNLKPVRIIFPSVTEDLSDRKEILAIAAPVKIGGSENGAIILFQPIEDFNGTVSEVRKLIFVVGIIGFVLTTVFAFFLSSRITSPLREMKRTAQRIAEGDFHAEVAIRSSDEIGDLASTFNTMAGRLNEVINALSNETEQLSSVLKNMVNGVIMINAEGKMVVTNPPAEHFLRDWRYESNSLPAPIFEMYQRVVQTEKEIHEEIPIQGRVWAVVMVPLHDRGQVRGALALLRDMTKEFKLDKLRKDFVANVSHELRTPLSMLQGYSEAIIDDIAASPEEHKELAQIIYDESVRMTKLVNELLDLARMEAGHIELYKDTIVLRPYLERIHRKFASLAKERGVNLELSYQTQRNDFDIDSDRIEQVLTNLIDNAMRHTPAGGTVTIRVKGDDPLYLEISDTGSGIPQEDLPFVFERFYKADKARTRGRAGTGLGLAIAKNIVDAHEGTITVHSKQGEGTTFTISLPAI
ncbi:ATP-binding protein [Brevibacillus ginsengisoli]|uniref:ATP-binding protein n=1 Tax=Brevibacillus ginsengisoli TaxID=363854 RepID=UPI003CEDC001